MSKPANAPLWIFIPNVLVPSSALEKLSANAQAQSFKDLPAHLLQIMARNHAPVYQVSNGLDQIEAWLLNHLDPQLQAKFDQYPAWAMATHADEQAPPAPFSRFWGTVSCLEIEHNGVRFIPPEVLQISQSDLQAFWAVVQPLLHAHGWRLLGTETGFHRLLSTPVPVPMEQASPWTLQNIRLTDYLPMTPDCSHWRRLWLNIQVQLHNAAFNQARQEKGLKPLNTLWFWGAGHAWQPQALLPRVKTVSVDGVFDAATMSDSANDTVNRLLFWNHLLAPLQNPAREQDTKPELIYCVNFQGWGSDLTIFKCLERDLLKPLSLVGLTLNWVLLGNQGWKTLNSNWINRLKFWKNTPNWAVLGEPDSQNHPNPQNSPRSEWEGH